MIIGLAIAGSGEAEGTAPISIQAKFLLTWGGNVAAYLLTVFLYLK